MIIIGIRTDRPDAELHFLDTEKGTTDQLIWHAHRALADTIHRQLEALLSRQGATLAQIEGLVAFEGPGSFTGLRIGLTVANTLAYSLSVPIIGSQSDSWLETGRDRLVAGENDKQVMPAYGAPVHITAQKK